MSTLSHARHEAADVPPAALWAMAGLVLLTLLTVGWTRWNADGTSPTAPTAPVVAERLLRFVDRADGGIDVHTGPERALLVTIPTGGEPFVRGALRALARERRSYGIGGEAPFRLQAHADGRLTLVDVATGRRLDLESFGPTQAGAFARLLGPATR